jgi:hypothetical protein
VRQTLGSCLLALYYQKQAASLTKGCTSWRNACKVRERYSEGVRGQSQCHKGTTSVNIWKKVFYAEVESVRSFKWVVQRPQQHPFFNCSQKVTLVLLGDHNFEIRIGSKGCDGQARGQSGAGHRAWARHCCHPPCPGWATPSAQVHYCSPSHACVCSSASPFLGEWWWVAVCHCGWQWIWKRAWPFSWIALVVVGVTAVPRLSGGTSQHPHVHALFPPLLVGVELGHVCSMAGGLCQSSNLLGPPVQLAAPPPGHACWHIYFSSHLFLGEWRWVTTLQLVAEAAALEASWDLPMDCFSCSGGCTWGGLGLGAHVAQRPRLVLTPAGSTPWATILWGTFASARCPAANLKLVWTKGPWQTRCGSNSRKS